MKKLYFVVALFLVAVLAVGCGSMRPASFNVKDDIDIERRKLGLESQDINVQNQQLDLEIRQQSFQIENQGAATDNGKVKTGIIANSFRSRKVEFEIKNGNHLVASYVIDGNSPPIIAQLPMGKYTVNEYHYRYKGRFFETSRVIEVTKFPNAIYQGQKYHFIVSN